MNKTNFGVGLLVFGVLTVAACSGDDGASSGGSVAIDDLPARYGQIACKRAYECCDKATLMSDDLAGPDEMTCRSNITGFVGFAVGGVKTSIGKGRVAYHGDKAGACLSALETTSCADLNGGADPAGAEACGQMFEGKVAVGGACAEDMECVSGACKEPAGDGDGVCEMRAADGASCTDDDVCSDASYCDSASKTCKAQKANGSMCGGDSECQSGDCTMGMCATMGGDGQCFINGSCSVAPGPITARGFAVAAVLMGLLVGAARRRRRR